MSAQEFLLAGDSLLGYLASRGLIQDEREVTIRELGGGVSNVVLLIEWWDQSERRWVAKQSLEKLRVKDDWRSQRERIFREAEAIQALGPLLGDGVLPQVISIDRDKYFYIMTAAPASSVVWKDSLLRGEVDLAVAREAGMLLSRTITGSRADSSFGERFADRTVFDQLRIDPYYRTTAARHPDVHPALARLIQDSWEIRTSIVHGDYSPKNMLVRDGKIFLIDFEVVHWGDPAFDAGFLLNHLLLKAFHQPQLMSVYLEAAREFWNGLVAGLGPEQIEDFEAMTMRHLGGLMLARIDGKSPVEYIRDEATRNRVRRVAKRILHEQPRELETALNIVTSDK
jgi:5-methylthioribose kinase